jgi:hypothetical protein
MAYSGLSGSGSLMPESAYLKKQEMTCLYESPDQLYEYNRATLRDERPDPVMFESDQKRDITYARDRLSLQYTGGRSNGVEPYLPEGSFVDYTFLEKDPRGTALGPNMMEYRKQENARGKFIKFYPDGDASVPSEGISPGNMQKNIKGQFYNVKDRLKIFEDSMDSWHNGGTQQVVKTDSAQCMIISDAKNPDMRDEMCYNRGNKTVDLSNNTSIGWRRTTDHIFKVAQYGQIRRSANPNETNILKNRGNAKIGHDILVAWQDQIVPKSVTLKMIDLAKQRVNDLENGKILTFGSSEINTTNKRKIKPTDLSLFANVNTDESQTMSAHANLRGDRNQHITGSMMKPQLDSNKMKKVIIDPFIIDFMGSINYRMSPREIKDLRNAIAQSSVTSGLLIDQTNKKCNAKLTINNDMLWQSATNYERGRSMTVANYAILSRTVNGPKSDHNTVDYEAYKVNQKESYNNRHGNLQDPDLYNMDVLEYDNDTGMEAVGTKLIGGMGSKYMNNYMTREDNENSFMSDITART